jgi:hypothetical protein
MKAFNGSWQVRGGVVNNEVRVTVDRGFVNGWEPIVDGVPIGGVGRDGKFVGQPTVRGQADYDKYGRVYVSLRVRVPVWKGSASEAPEDWEDGKMVTPPAEDDLTVVVTKIRESREQPIELGLWYQPLAVITHDGRLGQIAYFDYQHFTSARSGSARNNAIYSDDAEKTFLGYGKPFMTHFFSLA